MKAQKKNLTTLKHEEEKEEATKAVRASLTAVKHERVCAIISKFKNALDRYTTREKGRSTSISKFLALIYICQKNGQPMAKKELMEYCGLSTSGVSVMLTRLCEDDGLITQVRYPKDKRLFIITLTPAGKDIFKESEVGGKD